MKVFVAGGTGAIGARLLPKLVAAGHEVTAITRDPAKVVGLGEGVMGVVCDVFDSQQLGAAVAAAAPDVVVNQLTSLPAVFTPTAMKAAYAANNRVREEGTAKPIGGAVRVMRGVEEAVLGSGLEAVVLRYGMFYGPGTWHSRSGSAGRDMAKRRQPIIGKGRSVWSLIHVDDAAEATVAALTGPPGIYNIVDDHPAPQAEWLSGFAEALGAPKPLRVPRFVARLATGRGLAEWMDSLRSVSNERARRQLGWTPAHPSWREGFRDL